MRPKTDAEIAAMREGGRMLAELLKLAEASIKPGMSTKGLADILSAELKQLGGAATFLGYQGFPDVVCISVNEEVVHGIPSEKRIIKDGDVVGVDMGVTYKGMVVDGARTFFVGESLPSDIKRLLEATETALQAGVDAIHGDGTRVGDISAAVQEVLEQAKLGIVRDLVGHGVGYSLHEDPNIPNYGRKNNGLSLMQNMTIAIEPMATLGDWHINMLSDGWTVVTRDKSLAAQFEHTILITADGAEILTAV